MLKFNNLEIEWLGVSSIKIKTPKEVIYIDPYAIYDNEQADLILITHEHNRHCNPETIERLSKDSTLVISTEYASSLIENQNKQTIAPGQKIDYKGILIEAVHSYETLTAHPHYRGKGVGYIINIHGTRIYHAGDTDFIPEMHNIKDIDIACYPIADYEEDIEQAITAINQIKPTYVIPIHYDPSHRKKLHTFESKIINSRVVLG